MAQGFPQSSEQVLDELFREEKRTFKPKLRMEYLRDLTPEDVLKHTIEKPVVRTSAVLTLRHTHHNLARLIAEGRSDSEISRITGVSNPRIFSLKKDPAFKELVSFYSSKVQEEYLGVHERLAAISLDAIEVLHERLLESPEKFKVSDLQSTATLALDRTGYGPKSTVNQNVRVAVLSDELLLKIKEEAESRRLGAVRTLSEGGRVIDSFASLEPPKVESSEETQGGESSGAELREEIHQVPEEETPDLFSSPPESVDKFS